MQNISTYFPWLQEEALQKLVHVLGKGNLRVVGGVIRDSLLEKEVGDIDLAVSLPPYEVIKRLESSGIKVVATGLAYGTVTAVFKEQNQAFEITTLRQDVETDGRHAKVKYGVDWYEDAKRRDFTINSLSLDFNGKLYDPLSCGIKDLEQKRLVFIGTASTRIAEDYLRVFRFFRFHYLLSEKEPDKEAFLACQKAGKEKEGLADLSAERLQQELMKILALPKAVSAIESMHEAGVLDFMLPEYVGISFLSTVLQTAQEQKFQVDPLLRLICLIPQSSMSYKRIAKHLRLSNKQAKMMQNIYEIVMNFQNLSCSLARQLIYRYGKALFLQACILKFHQQGVFESWYELRKFVTDWEIPIFELNGTILKKEGFVDGKEMGKILRQIEMEWIESDFTKDAYKILKNFK